MGIPENLEAMNSELLMVGNDYSDILLPAAREIADLQARLAECERAKDDHFMNSCLRANIESLATENDKIRAQLAETQKLLSVQLAVGDKLTAEVARLKQASIVLGVMHCAKCNFELTRVTLYMGNGAVGPGDSNTEPCPNGCGPMWPVTWESRAREQMAVAERFFDEKQKAEAELAALRTMVEKAPHAINCATGKGGYMVGEISLDVNTRPNAQEVKPECNCWKRAALEK